MYLPKWMFILQYIENEVLNQMSIKYNISYSYLCRIIKKMENENLIKTELDGRIKKINLTEKGKKLKKHSKQILNEFDR